MKHILLAEDNALNRRLYTDILRLNGFEVTAVNDGLEALEVAREHRPDLILLDLQLPVCSGHEAIRRLRDDADLAELPVIAVSAFAHRDDRDKAIANGFTDFICKPAPLDEFVDTVRRHLAADAGVMG